AAARGRRLPAPRARRTGAGAGGVWKGRRLMSVRPITPVLRRVLRRPRAAASASTPRDASVSPRDAAIVERATPYTMTGEQRLLALVDAVRYCVRAGVPGAFAECGVWRGGSVLAMILTLQDLGVDDRDIHLYDTFEGMTAPTEVDT